MTIVSAMPMTANLHGVGGGGMQDGQLAPPSAGRKGGDPHDESSDRLDCSQLQVDRNGKRATRHSKHRDERYDEPFHPWRIPHCTRPAHRGADNDEQPHRHQYDGEDDRKRKRERNLEYREANRQRHGRCDDRPNECTQERLQRALYTPVAVRHLEG